MVDGQLVRGRPGGFSGGLDERQKWMPAHILGTTTPAGTRMRDIGHFIQHVGQAVIKAAEEWGQAHAAGRTVHG